MTLECNFGVYDPITQTVEPASQCVPLSRLKPPTTSTDGQVLTIQSDGSVTAEDVPGGTGGADGADGADGTDGAQVLTASPMAGD